MGLALQRGGDDACCFKGVEVRFEDLGDGDKTLNESVDESKDHDALNSEGWKFWRPH